MRYRPLGQSGIEASVIGLGTWAIGGLYWGGTDEQRSIAAIQAALDEGINLIDTAPGYGYGLSEELIGRAIRERRDRVVLATKCGLVWDRNARREDKPKIEHNLKPDSVRWEVEQSLRRLGTDRIDLLQTHWPDPATPIEDTMAALLDLKRQGKVRAIGVSNVSIEQLKAYQKLGPVDSDQEKFSMLDRAHVRDGLIPYCQQQHIAVLAYSPMELGLLTGKVGADREFPPDDLRAKNPRFSKDNRRRVMAMLEEFQHLAHGCGLSMAQLVLLWTISQPGVTHALAGARDPQQARDNAAAGHERFDQYDLSQMKEAMDKHLPGIA